MNKKCIIKLDNKFENDLNRFQVYVFDKILNKSVIHESFEIDLSFLNQKDILENYVIYFGYIINYWKLF